MHNTGRVFDCGRLAWGKLIGRNDLVVEWKDPGLLPCLQDQLRGECCEVCRPKDLRKVTCCDTAVTLLLEFSNLFAPVELQLCEAYNVKALKEVGTM